ncbi:UNVERIFIED_CONTAM: hypothetical protein NCL1_37280 [Trichonephila clavipes]
MDISSKKELRKKFFNTHKNTSWPNNPSKCSIFLSIYHKTQLHEEKKATENIIYNFPKRKGDGVKHNMTLTL